MGIKKTYEEAKTPIYGNWRVFHPEGHLMFYGDDSKANWYLKRNLAVIIEDRAIQLTFTPKGRGSALDLYGATPKENICVVCGGTEELTRHHIVPYCYRKHFPEEYKSNNFHDVVPVCGQHHKDYEIKASELKNLIGIQYGMADMMVSKITEEVRDKRHIGGILMCLIERKDKLPKEKIEEMESKIKDFFQLVNLPDNLTDLFDKVKIKQTYRSKRERSKFKVLVDRIENIQDFVEKWRLHFIETMKPQHLPVGWDIKRDARRLEWLIRNNKAEGVPVISIRKDT